jgi:hypothetical protein
VIHMRLIAKRENRLGRSWCGCPGNGSFQEISLIVAGNLACTIVVIKFVGSSEYLSPSKIYATARILETIRVFLQLSSKYHHLYLEDINVVKFLYSLRAP